MIKVILRYATSSLISHVSCYYFKQYEKYFDFTEYPISLLTRKILEILVFICLPKYTLHYFLIIVVDSTCGCCNPPFLRKSPLPSPSFRYKDIRKYPSQESLSQSEGSGSVSSVDETMTQIEEERVLIDAIVSALTPMLSTKQRGFMKQVPILGFGNNRLSR